MSTPELSTHDAIAVIVLAQFETQEIPPRLTQNSQQIMKAYFEKKGLVMVGGAIGQPSAGSTDSLVSMAMKDLILPADAATQPVVGPNFMGDHYFPGGVGLWMPAAGKPTE